MYCRVSVSDYFDNWGGIKKIFDNNTSYLMHVQIQMLCIGMNENKTKCPIFLAIFNQLIIINK